MAYFSFVELRNQNSKVTQNNYIFRKKKNNYFKVFLLIEIY